MLGHDVKYSNGVKKKSETYVLVDVVKKSRSQTKKLQRVMGSAVSGRDAGAPRTATATLPLTVKNTPALSAVKGSPFAGAGTVQQSLREIFSDIVAVV